MGASPAGVLRNSLLIVSVLVVGCTGSPPSQTLPTLTTAPSTATPGATSPSVSSPPPAQTPSICDWPQLVDDPPDGRLFSDVQGWIAYRSGSQLKAVDPAQPYARLSLGPVHGADPIGWSPDGTRLLLRREEILPQDPRCLGSDLFVLDASGSMTELSFALDPVWGSFSPDGDRVAYGSRHDGPYVIDADGGKNRYLGPGSGPADLVAGCFSESAAWSPDGSRIAFIDATFGECIYGVSVVNPDSTGLAKLVKLGGGADGLVWSPDGSRLAFWMTGKFTSRAQIYVIDADGSGLLRITNEGDNRWPAWSPDGSRIAFVSDGRLFTMAPDGSDVRRVKGVKPDGAIAWNPAG